jgi:MFS transporter, UMF1 family
MAPDAPAARPDAGTPARLAWALYDWAVSPFSAVVVTFVFPTYFAKALAADEVEGAALWGWAMTGSALLVALLSPPLGAIADAGGRRKPWLLAATLAAAAATSALWWAEPAAAAIPLTLLVVLVANTAVELGQTFYNAMLPDLAPAGRLGRWSGWGWGLGYLAGIAALLLCLAGFIQADPPPFGLDREAAEQVRIAGPIVGAWLLLFALPLFLLCPDRRPVAAVTPGAAVADGLARLGGTLRRLRAQPVLLRFLLARLVYNDGLGTLFAFGGIYAAGTFGMTLEEVIRLGIALNLTAGIGALALARLDDRLGSKPTILLSLAGLILAGSVALLATSKAAFWASALLLGCFVGPAQSASRTLMARLSPPDRLGEMFGLYALSGRVSAPLGPFLFGSAAWLFGTQRAGMATVLAMLALGALLLLPVREPRLTGR